MNKPYKPIILKSIIWLLLCSHQLTAWGSGPVQNMGHLEVSQLENQMIKVDLVLPRWAGAFLTVPPIKDQTIQLETVQAAMLQDELFPPCQANSCSWLDTAMIVSPEQIRSIAKCNINPSTNKVCLQFPWLGQTPEEFYIVGQIQLNQKKNYLRIAADQPAIVLNHKGEIVGRTEANESDPLNYIWAYVGGLLLLTVIAILNRSNLIKLKHRVRRIIIRSTDLS